MNQNHFPAGSARGGQFAPTRGGGARSTSLLTPRFRAAAAATPSKTLTESEHREEGRKWLAKAREATNAADRRHYQQQASNHIGEASRLRDLRHGWDEPVRAGAPAAPAASTSSLPSPPKTSKEAGTLADYHANRERMKTSRPAPVAPSPKASQPRPPHETPGFTPFPKERPDIVVGHKALLNGEMDFSRPWKIHGVEGEHVHLRRGSEKKKAHASDVMGQKAWPDHLSGE